MRALSGAVAAALLVLATVSAATLLYLWAAAASQPPAGRAALPALKIDAVEPVQGGGGGRCVYLRVYLRDAGAAPATVEGNTSGYLEGDTVAVLRAAPLRSYRLAPGEEAQLRLVPARRVESPRLLRVVAAGGVEASATVRGCRVALLGVVHRHPPVDGSREATVLPGGVRVETWVEYYATDGSGLRLYRVWFNVTPPPGLVVRYARAEILTASGGHPVWAASPVAEHWGLRWPDWWAEYWAPVREDEFPVTVVVSLDYGG